MNRFGRGLFIVGCLFVLNLTVIHSQAFALIINETEPNDSLLTAQNIDAFFSLGENADIANSLTSPWVSILATGNNTFDYFSFNVSQAGIQGLFDIDYAFTLSQELDTQLFLFDINGTLLNEGDDDFSNPGANGSEFGFDPFIEYTFLSSGDYVLAVSQFPSNGLNDGSIEGIAIPEGTSYTLQVSLSEHSVTGGNNSSNAVPEPASMSLMGLGMAAMAYIRKKKQL